MFAKQFRLSGELPPLYIRVGGELPPAFEEYRRVLDLLASDVHVHDVASNLTKVWKWIIKDTVVQEHLTKGPLRNQPGQFCLLFWFLRGKTVFEIIH